MIVDAVAHAAFRASRAALAPPVGALARLGFAAMDAALTSPYADEVVRHLLASRLADRALAAALSDGALDRALDRIEGAGVPERIVGVVVESEPMRDAVAVALDSPGLERMIAVALESAGLERMIMRVVESRVVDDAVARVAEEAIERLRRTDAMWALIEEVAASPVVTDAISQQGSSFADHVAEEMRDRSRSADARLERAVRRMWRRGRPGGPAPASGGT